MKENSALNGIIVVDKPSKWTSRDVVNKISHILNTKKVGHTGTLDPLATGVLVITIGKCTKLNEILTSDYKEYIAEFILGIETDTLDTDGVTIKTSPVNCTKEKIIEAVYNYKGTYNQEVPFFSAVKIKGKRLYDYARQGKEVILPKRVVDIRDIEIIKIDLPYVKIKCTVSKGTYIRSLIRDIGKYLGVYATMSSLRRIKQGKYTVNESNTISDIEDGQYKLIKIEDILDVLVIYTDSTLKKRVENGVVITEYFPKDYILFKDNETDIALYRKEKGTYRMFIKF